MPALIALKPEAGKGQFMSATAGFGVQISEGRIYNSAPCTARAGPGGQVASYRHAGLAQRRIALMDRAPGNAWPDRRRKTE
jgi:hypothetical protein